jgi:membrane-bound lytic murein transglycosylase D
MNKPVILAAGSPQVLLPYDNANQFLRALAAHRGPLASWTAWVAPRTVKPADAARLVGMPEAQLREVNFIPERMLVKAGSTLLVPRSAQTTVDVPNHLADNAMMALAPEARPLRKLSFKAGKKGDTVAAVAKRYKVTAAQVAQWNKVSAQASFKPGQVVTLMVPAAAGKTASNKAGVRSAKVGAKRAGQKVAKKAGKTRVAKR